MVLAIGLALWLWPMGLGGRMPVGGDVTQFSLGLMAFLQKSLRSGYLPTWNPLWGYGFPGLGESQMGVYYPPHWLLYGTLSLEWAYTASLVFHTFWGGLGGYWAARRFQASPAGAALAGFSWAASGFFLIHIPHQWGYTVGSWMPWALGLAWSLGNGRSRLRTWLLLVLVLTLQILPGHFQLAFCTQVGLILLALGGLGRDRASKLRLGLVVLAIAATLPLGAMQLLPTYRLARLAEARRDFEYLSGFAVSPLHLLSYLAPGLFHISPLWRPLAWDPFHTSPEEYLGYVGLVSLYLAWRIVWQEARSRPETRAILVLCLGTLFFSLGPYAPGFALWCKIPGFSFFRAPARWTLATELAICLLAARGFDASRAWAKIGLSALKFAATAVVLLGLVVGAVELALMSTERGGLPSVADGFQQAMNLMPWARVSGARSARDTQPAPEPTFRELMALARQPQNDSRVATALARQGETLGRSSGWRFATRRGSIYRQELMSTAMLLLGFVILGFGLASRRESALPIALIALSFVDLLILGRQRPFDLGPVESLAKQSPVMSRLHSLAPGRRSIDPIRNLPMVVGAAPVSAYRTLDLPILTTLTDGSQANFGAPAQDQEILASIRAVGAVLRILDPSQTILMSGIGPRLPHWQGRETVVDPALAGWLLGVDWVKQQGSRAATFTLWQPTPETSEAWFVDMKAEDSNATLKSWSGEKRRVLTTLEQARPLKMERPRPDRVRLEVEAKGPGAVVLTQLSDPQWEARWSTSDGQTNKGATIATVFRQGTGLGWQGVMIPGPGRWILSLDYNARDVRLGLWISGVTGLFWLIGFLASFLGKTPIQGETQ